MLIQRAKVRGFIDLANYSKHKLNTRQSSYKHLIV